jgi:hypothetical protein
MNKKTLLELLSFPAEKTLPETDVEKLKAYDKDLDNLIEQLTDYKEKVKEQLDEKANKPRLKELAQKLFDLCPESNFLAFLERACDDDDSGNCFWTTEEGACDIFPDVEEEITLSKEMDAVYEEALNLFEEIYPDLNFDDDDNAYWDSRPTAYYGLNRNMEAVYWDTEEEEEDK